MAQATDRCCLLGIDDNESSATAFEFYVSHVHRQGDKIVLVHVVPPHVWSTNHWMVPTHLDATRERAMADEKEKVTRLQETYQEMMQVNGIPGRINVIYYVHEVGKVLCKIALEENCAMIIVGTRRSHTPESDTLGNIVDYVLRKSCTPVVIARKTTESADVNGPRQSIVYSQTFPERQIFESKSKVRNDAKSRKISLPAMQMSPPSYDELSFRFDASSTRERRRSSEEKPEKVRRHSSIVNSFKQLTFFNGIKKIASTKEEDLNGE